MSIISSAFARMGVRKASLLTAACWLLLASAAMWQISDTRHGVAALMFIALLAVARYLPQVETTRQASDVAVLVTMAVFGVLLVFRTLTSPQVHTALAIATFIVVYPLAFFVGRRTQVPDVRVLFCVLVAPLVAVLTVWAYWNHLQGQPIYGPADDANGFAAMISVLLIAAVGMATVDVRLRGIVSLFALPALGALYLTESRGTLLALGLFVGALLTFRLAGVSAALSMRRRYAVLAGMTVVLAVVASLGVGYVHQRLQQHEVSMAGRVALLQSAVEIGLQQGPWVGEGIGTFTRYYQERRPLADQDSIGARAHNDYLELFADGGLLLALALAAVSVAVWRAFALSWYRGSSLQAVLLSGAAYLALYAAFNHTYINMFLSLLGGLFAGWGTQSSSAQEAPDRIGKVASGLSRTSPLLIVVLLTPALLFYSIVELHVHAAVAPLSSPLWAPFRTEIGLRLLSESGFAPRATFVYGLRAENALLHLPPGHPERPALAREALGRYVKAYQQDVRNSNYAYQTARLLANTPEFANEPRMETWTNIWFQTAVRLNKFNFAAVRSYSRWLESRGRADEAVALLHDRARRVHNASLRQPLLDEASRITKAARTYSEPAQVESISASR